jgi:hypothetical protein
MDKEGFQQVEVICTLDSQTTTGHVWRRDFTRTDRMTRALKMGGIFFGVTFITLFIPVLHFVLVPLFLLLTVVFGFNAWMEKGEVLKGEVLCPNCSEKFLFSREAEGWPKSQRCPKCTFLLSFDIRRGRA